MQTLRVVFTPLNHFSADRKNTYLFFFKSSLTYFSSIKIGGGHLARSPCQKCLLNIFDEPLHQISCSQYRFIRCVKCFKFQNLLLNPLFFTILNFSLIVILIRTAFLCLSNFFFKLEFQRSRENLECLGVAGSR